MKRKFNFISFIGVIIALTIAMQSNISAQQILLNEVEIDAPDTKTEACSYIELRGTPGTTVPLNTYFLSINTDSGNFGFVTSSNNVGGLVFGLNGTITLINVTEGPCGTRVFPAGTTLVPTLLARLGFGSEEFLLVNSTTAIASGSDVDSEDDFELDSNLGITVRDGFALLGNSLEEPVYGDEAGVMNISNQDNSTEQPDAVTRFPGNNTPFAIGAFYYGELAASPDDTTTYAAPFSPNFPTGGALTPGAPNFGPAAQSKAVVDYNGDGRTDYSIVRNQGGNLVWYSVNSGFGVITGTQFGAQGDVAVPEDYDGDGKDDIAVWRSAAFANFYILNSSNNTVRIEQFGQTGDNPTIVGDWDGDDKADLAVYRNASAAGEVSFFFYRPSSQVGVDFIPIRWGTNGDLPQRGDFDGDNKQDAAVFRPSDAIWYIRQSSNSQQRSERWGLASDRRVPADYDGDGKTDLAVFRNGLWAVLQSSNSQPLNYQFGQASDTLVPGDYTGDGRTDFAVWRQGVFYVAPNGSGTTTGLSFGTTTDFPVASIFTN